MEDGLFRVGAGSESRSQGQHEGMDAGCRDAG
jgi:hypothetical protein